MKTKAKPHPLNPPPPHKILKAITNIPQAEEPVEKHTLDPSNNNVLQLEGALQPYKPPEVNENNDTPDFDLMELLADVQDEQAMVMAATQMENNYQNSTSTSMSKTNVMSSKPSFPTFTGCTFRSIGTLNIHIHKNKEEGINIYWH